MKRFLSLLICAIMILSFAACANQPSEKTDSQPATVQEEQADTIEQREFVYGFASIYDENEFPDTGKGFEFAAQLTGMKGIMTYAQFDGDKELENIEYLIEQGVDGICFMPLLPENLPVIIEKCTAANIPLVVFFSLGEALRTGTDIVACVDPDYEAMGAALAEYVSSQHPDSPVARIVGTEQTILTQHMNKGFEKTLDANSNPIIATKEGYYDPMNAQMEFTTLIGDYGDFTKHRFDFSVLYVETDTMVEGIVPEFDNYSLRDEISIISTIGTQEGVALVESGKIEYAVINNLGLLEMVAYLALHAYNTGIETTLNQQINMPVLPVTRETADTAKLQPDLAWCGIVAEYFPGYMELLDESTLNAIESQPTATPQPTSIEAKSRQDLIDYGFLVEDDYGEEYYSFNSRVSDSRYRIYYSDDHSEGWGGGTYIPRPCIEDPKERIRFHISSRNGDPTIQYYPELDAEITAKVYKDLEKFQYFDGMREGFYYAINLKDGSIVVYSYGMMPAYINDYVKKYVDLDAVFQEAMQKFETLDQNLKQELGVTAAEILELK